MSYLELDATPHNIFLSLAIESLISKQGGQLVFADGGLPFRAHRRAFPPSVRGYRPDAMIMAGKDMFHWLIEVKSFNDLKTEHSRTQFMTVSRILAEDNFMGFYLFVFGVEDKNMTVPEELIELSSSGRLLITYTDLALESGSNDHAI